MGGYVGVYVLVVGKCVGEGLESIDIFDYPHDYIRPQMLYGAPYLLIEGINTVGTCLKLIRMTWTAFQSRHDCAVKYSHVPVGCLHTKPMGIFTHKNQKRDSGDLFENQHVHYSTFAWLNAKQSK
jgi:hypothetical protein